MVTSLILIVALYLVWLIHQTIFVMMDQQPAKFRFLIFTAIIVSALGGVLIGRFAWITAHWVEFSQVPWTIAPYERTDTLITWAGTMPWLLLRFDHGVNWSIALWGASTLWVYTYWLPLITNIINPKKTLLPPAQIRFAQVMLGLSLLWWWALKIVYLPFGSTDIVWFVVTLVGLLVQWRWSVLSGWYLVMITMIGWQSWLRNWWEVIFLVVLFVFVIITRLIEQRRKTIHEA